MVLALLASKYAFPPESVMWILVWFTPVRPQQHRRHPAPSLRSRLYADLHSVDFAGRPRGGCAGVRFPKFALRSEGRLQTLIRRVVIAACRTTGNSDIRRA